MKWLSGLLLVALACIWTAEGGTIYKHIFQNGTGAYPAANMRVIVHYIGNLKSTGAKFDSSCDRNEPFRFKLHAGEVITGWDYGVDSMRVGERAQFEIPPEYAYGTTGAPPDIPANATLVFSIELLGIETPGAASANTQYNSVLCSSTTA